MQSNPSQNQKKETSDWYFTFEEAKSSLMEIVDEDLESLFKPDYPGYMNVFKEMCIKLKQFLNSGNDITQFDWESASIDQNATQKVQFFMTWKHQKETNSQNPGPYLHVSWNRGFRETSIQPEQQPNFPQLSDQIPGSGQYPGDGHNPGDGQNHGQPLASHPQNHEQPLEPQLAYATHQEIGQNQGHGSKKSGQAQTSQKDPILGQPVKNQKGKNNQKQSFFQ